MSEYIDGSGNPRPQQPEDVTLAAVQAVGESFGYSCYLAADRLLFPWRDHRVTAYLLGGPGQHSGKAETLVFDGVLRQILDMGKINLLAESINTWNQERLGPTLSFRMGDAGELFIRARSAIEVRPGLNDEQLAGALHNAMETIQLAVSTLLDDFPELHFPDEAGADADPRHAQDRAVLQQPLPGALPDDGRSDTGAALPDPAGRGRHNQEGVSSEMSPRHASPDPDDPADDHDHDHTEELPYPVTLDRVRGALAELGVLKTRGDEEVIVAWVNDVLFGFFLDNGPSYLVKGHWDPNLDPERDFLRIFLLCNDWNEASVNTKAFCHADEDGLQVRVEFTTPIGEGLNDAQLAHNTAVAINQVLHALDSLSTDAVGESVVGWPGRDEV